jgi:dnd system-associated protein 4
MARIRIPIEAQPLLRFCDRNEPHEDNACFSTNADMVIFAAGYGFHRLGKQPPSGCSAFLSSPEPIDLDVFRNRQLFPLILLLGMTVAGNYEIARQEERLATLMENYAAAGFAALAKKLENSTPQEFHIDMARLLEEAAEDDDLAKL